MCINYIVFICFVDMCSNLIVCIHHCICVTKMFLYKMRNLVSYAYFVFYYFRGVIYNMWQVIFENFHCKFMFSSESIYQLFLYDFL